MTRLLLSSVFLMLPLALSGCDRGPYDPSAHRQAEASTGTMLSGTDSGANLDANMNNNPSMRSNYTTMSGK